MNSKLKHIFYLLNLRSKNNYLVGGCVRDKFVGKEPKDYDIVTDVPMDISKIDLENAGFSVKECGEAFLVLNVSKDGEQWEIANFRSEKFMKKPKKVKKTKIGEVIDFDPNNIDHLDSSKYEVVEWEYEHDGRRPSKVEIGTIEDDAKRRDFTINALYKNPLTGEVLDPTGMGLSDIMDKTLRFIGNPKERIQEDYLRVFRFYRFLATKNLKADPKSLKACRQYFNEAYLNTTPERVRLELERLI